MCGRFNNYLTTEQMRNLYNAEPIGNAAGFMGSYNVAISEPALMVRNGDNQHREIALASFGTMMSSGSKNIPVFNLRSETAGNRKDFQTRRCVISAAGFYEWEKITPKDKQPYYFSPKGEVFSFAGVWNQSSDGVSFSILTTQPNALVSPIHNRMPVILSLDAVDRWLASDADSDSLSKLMQPYPADDMQCWKVSKSVNSVKNKNAECINSI